LRPICGAKPEGRVSRGLPAGTLLRGRKAEHVHREFSLGSHLSHFVAEAITARLSRVPDGVSTEACNTAEVTKLFHRIRNPDLEKVLG
jgi:hypothetical protein